MYLLVKGNPLNKKNSNFKKILHARRNCSISSMLTNVKLLSENVPKSLQITVLCLQGCKILYHL